MYCSRTVALHGSDAILELSTAQVGNITKDTERGSLTVGVAVAGYNKNELVKVSFYLAHMKKTQMTPGLMLMDEMLSWNAPLKFMQELGRVPTLICSEAPCMSPSTQTVPTEILG